MAHPEYKTNQIYHYTSTNPEKAANAAYLMGAFQVLAPLLRYSSWAVVPERLSSPSRV